MALSRNVFHLEDEQHDGLQAFNRSGPKVIKHFPCSTQLSMKFFLLMNVKMPTNVGSLTFMSRKNSILGLSEPENSCILDIFILMSI